MYSCFLKQGLLSNPVHVSMTKSNTFTVKSRLWAYFVLKFCLSDLVPSPCAVSRLHRRVQ